MLPERLPFAIDTRRLRSFDGTAIAYHVTASPAPGAPWIVLANGLGGGPLIWRRQIDYLRHRYRFVSWDYRGLDDPQTPGRPRPERPDAYAVANHVRDLEAILAAERIDRAGFVGWSTGVQVVLEAAARLRGRAQSLVLVSGGAGRPLSSLTPIPGVRAALLPFLALFRRAYRFRDGAAAHRPIGQRTASAWIKGLGLVGRSAEQADVDMLTASVGRLDRDAFLRSLFAFGEHDATELLTSVTVPALVIAGDRDPLLPREIAQQMARRIARAELLVVRGGAHATPIEYPELVALRIERFYREHGL